MRGSSSSPTVKPPSRRGGMLLGFPDRLVFTDRSGEKTEFILADPAEVVAWHPDQVRAPNLKTRTTR